MEKSLKKLKEVVEKRIDPDGAWWFDCENELRISEIENLFNLTDSEVEEFATTSCNTQLWVFRALTHRLGVPVRKADWAWYNL